MSTAVEIRRYDGEAISADAELRLRLGELFVGVFSEPPYDEDPANPGEWAENRLLTHAGFPGFRLVCATREERLLGFAYGMLGGEQQWFTRTVRERLTPGLAELWLGGHGELVELAVHRDARGTGLGRRLHDAAVEDLRAVGARTALLVADVQAVAARALYVASGWTDVAEVAPGSMLMGRELREGGFSDRAPG